MVALALLAVGCRQDMHDQPKYETLAASTFFPDGQSARPVIPGTVARGQLRIDEALYQGRAGGNHVAESPIPVTPPLVARGRERYRIFCSPCHGGLGDGEGMVVQRGFRRPPSFHIDRLRDAPAGHYFDVITNGFGSMASYAARVPPADRWAIVAYIRALQLSQRASLNDVPEDERGKLEGAR